MMEFDLKEVFSILDENDEGQIQLRRFVDVANNYYSDAEQLARITKALDPRNTGLINFDQFCQGIAQISSLQGVSLKDVASDLSRLSREPSLTEDSDQRSLNQDGSTTTFNEYDVESDETSHQQNTSKIPSITKTTKTKKKSTNQNSQQNNQSSSSTLDSSIFGDEEEFSGIAEPDSSIYLSDPIHPRSVISQHTSPSTKRNYLVNINPSEEIEQQLHETVDELQKTVEVLTEQKAITTDHLTKIQSENTDLRKRLLDLEYRFHDLEGHQERSIQSEREKYADVLTHNNRSFLQEKEILQSRINAIEAELEHTHTTNGQMRKDVEQLKEKLDDVDVQLYDSQLRCNYLSEDNEKLLEQLRRQREDLEAEKLTNAQLAEQLTSESSRKIFSHTLSRTESIIKSFETRIQDLDSQVRALKLENKKLKQENDDLNERAVASAIREGQTLMARPRSLSYDAELEFLSKDELMSKLREQLLVNDRLRQYIERILGVIIENSPQLLEVTAVGDASMGSLGMPPTNPRKQSLVISSNEIENKSLPVQSLKSTESIMSDSSSTSSTTKKSNDKYCRV